MAQKNNLSGKRTQYAEYRFLDKSWLQLHLNEVRLIGSDNKIRRTLQFRSYAAAAAAWPILTALRTAHFSQEAAR